jgi:hypothetical protein
MGPIFQHQQSVAKHASWWPSSTSSPAAAADACPARSRDASANERIDRCARGGVRWLACGSHRRAYCEVSAAKHGAEKLPWREEDAAAGIVWEAAAGGCGAFPKFSSPPASQWGQFFMEIFKVWVIFLVGDRNWKFGSCVLEIWQPLGIWQRWNLAIINMVLGTSHVIC